MINDFSYDTFYSFFMYFTVRNSIGDNYQITDGLGLHFIHSVEKGMLMSSLSIVCIDFSPRIKAALYHSELVSNVS